MAHQNIFIDLKRKERHMALNCKAGDLAVVISDEPGCEDNIGRIVKVQRRTLVPDSTGAWWSIRPIDRKPWTCIEPIQGGKWFEVYQYSGAIVIEDRCLLPIRGERPAKERQARSRTQRAAKAPSKKLAAGKPATVL